MEKPMLQPINPVLPAIAADPYNINVAMPTVDPIGTEQRIEQINQMRAAQAAQRQQLRQGEMSIENQRQQLAQQAERFALEKQKYEDEQLKALDTYRSDAFIQYDQLTSLPKFSKNDEDTLNKLFTKFGVQDLPNLLNSDDKIQVQGATNQMRKLMADPKMQEYVRKVKTWEVIEKQVLANPSRYNLGKVREIKERIISGGIGASDLDKIRMTDLIQSPNPTKTFELAFNSFIGVSGYPSTPEETALASEHITNFLSMEGIDADPTQVAAMIQSGIVTSDKLEEIAQSLASSFNVDVAQVLPFLQAAYKGGGPPGLQAALLQFQKNFGNIQEEKVEIEGRLKNAAATAANKDSGSGGGGEGTRSRSELIRLYGDKEAENIRKKELQAADVPAKIRQLDGMLYRTYNYELDLTEVDDLDNLYRTMDDSGLYGETPPLGVVAKAYHVQRRLDDMTDDMERQLLVSRALEEALYKKGRRNLTFDIETMTIPQATTADLTKQYSWDAKAVIDKLDELLNKQSSVGRTKSKRVQESMIKSGVKPTTAQDLLNAHFN